MKPDPQVPQQQADRHVQEPHVELLRRRPNPALVHLPIARLDPEPFPDVSFTQSTRLGVIPQYA